LEAMLTAAVGAILGFCFLYFGLVVAQPVLDSAYGLWLPIESPKWREIGVVLAVVAAGAIVSLVPAYRAYRLSLADGMMVKS